MNHQRFAGVQVFCQDARDLSTNRERARKYLIEKLDVFYNQEQSKQSKEQEKFRKRKQNSKRKSKKKYDVADGSSSEGSDGDMADTDANEEEQDLHLSFDEQLLIQQAISRIAI
jgi:protein subunit release factor B